MFHKPPFPVFSLAFLTGLIPMAPLCAQQTTLQPSVEVTASRMADHVDASLADVSVITRADIDASGAGDLIDLLRLQAGVDITRSGGAGEQTSLFLRGTNSNHVLVLINGVRVASTNTGTFAFENLPLDAVQRIEIVRGPRAAYWGSGAIGGVIQIFTRRLDGAEVAAGYGSYRSAQGSAGFGTWSDAGGFSVQAGLRHVGGFSAQNPSGCCYNPDDDGYHNRNVVAQGAYALGTQTLAASLFRSEGGVAFDEGYSHTLDQAIGIDLQGAVADHWQQRLALGTAREDIDTPAFLSAYYSTREQASWTHAFAFSAQDHLVAGADYVHDHGVSYDEYANAPSYARDRDDRGLFAGWRVRDGAVDSELAARYDNYSDFGSAVSGSVALGWQTAAGIRLSAGLGSAFRAPNLNELYSPGYGGYYAGNPTLNPERSHTAEVGLDWRLDSSNSLTAHAFSTRVHDLIDFSGGDTFQAVNIDRAAIDGLELAHRWQGESWSLDENATWQNPRNRSDGSQLLRRPRIKFSGVVQRRLGAGGEVGLELVASGRREDVAAYTLPGYALVNLRLSYRPAPTWQVTLRLENALDRDYELVHGYNTAGRSAHLELRWQPRTN